MKPAKLLADDPKVRSHFRLRLADARAAALADGEAAEQVIFAIEYLGRFLAGKAESLEQTSEAILRWVGARLGPERRALLDPRLQLLRRSRNERMHAGFAARNLRADAVRVALILEDALRVKWERLSAEDVMSPSPLEAKPWQTFGMAREAMLANAYSHLPVWWDAEWRAISERSMCRLARSARNQKVNLQTTRLDATHPKLGSLTLLDQLTDRETTTTSPGTKVLDLDLDTGCILVVDAPDGQPPRLLGIITPADLL